MLTSEDLVNTSKEEKRSNQKALPLDQIVASLKDMQRKTYSKETEWLFERTQMQGRISQLEGMLRAQENINEDLVKRIKMLEFCLREERIKYSRTMQKMASNDSAAAVGASAINTEQQESVIGSVLKSADLNAGLYERIAKRRAKAQRPILLKFLQEVGYEDIFNENEITEIKDMYEKAQQEMQESIAASQDEYKFHKPASLNVAKDSETSAIHQDKQKEGETVMMPLQLKMEPKMSLRSHFDMVRGLYVTPSPDRIVASISEDCMIKLWSLPDLHQKYEDKKGNVEPYVTLRGHTGPLLSITGRNDTIFTAGIEGYIKKWSIPKVSDVNQYGDTFEGKNYCEMTFSAWEYLKNYNGQDDDREKNKDEQKHDAIWDLAYHPIDELLLSCGEQVVLWDIKKLSSSQSEQDASKIAKLIKTSDDVTPCCVTWLPTAMHMLAIGHTDGTISFYDKSSDKVIKTIKMPASDNNLSNQPNKMVTDSTSPLLIAGLDNGTLVCIDTSKYEVCASIKTTHGNDGIADLCLDGQRKLEIVTAGHDGKLALWDVRQAVSKGEIEEIKPGMPEQVHSKKHDEGALCVQMLSDLPMCVSGGADGFVKIYDVTNPETEKLEDK